MADWLIEPLDKRRICQKRRRTAQCEPQPMDALPAEWRELLARWVRRGGNSRWETLRKDAGTTRVQLADALLDWLLRSSWIAVTEQWKLGAWWPRQIELLNLPHLRAALGLRDKDDEALRWQEIRTALQTLDNEALLPAVLALDALPVQRALARQDLIFKLCGWQMRQQKASKRATCNRRDGCDSHPRASCLKVATDTATARDGFSPLDYSLLPQAEEGLACPEPV